MYTESDIDKASLADLNVLLGEHLEGLRRKLNQRIPSHIAAHELCYCDPLCYEDFLYDWKVAEPHVETILEAMVQAGYQYLAQSDFMNAAESANLKVAELGHYCWFKGKDSETMHQGYDAISPILAAYRSAAKALAALMLEGRSPIIDRNEFKIMVCQYLDVNPNDVRCIQLHLEVGEPVTAKVEAYDINEDGKKYLSDDHPITWNHPPVGN